jgi:uncharacterized membrane protein (DUF485 family)
MWIGFYITASIFQAIAIENDRPNYKKVFIHNLWITAIMVFLFVAYLSGVPRAASLKYGMDFTNSGVLLFSVAWGFLMGYITNAITGLLTVFWLTRARLKQDRVESSQRSQHTFESLTNLNAPEKQDPKSDYGLASTISSGIDSIAQDMGPNALDKATVTLDQDGDISVVFMATPFKLSAGIRAYFHLNTYDKIKLLKESAGKRDNLSYMAMDIAGREILKKLKEQS